MNNAGNTIPKKQSCFHKVNQTERALSALLPSLREDMIKALKEEPEQTAFQLANSCCADVERIIAHIDKLMRYDYVDIKPSSIGIRYCLNEEKMMRVKKALYNFSNPLNVKM